MNFQPADFLAMQPGIVIEHCYRQKFVAALQADRKLNAGRAGSINNDLFSFLVRPVFDQK